MKASTQSDSPGGTTGPERRPVYFILRRYVFRNYFCDCSFLVAVRLSFVQVQLLNAKTEEQYTFMSSGDAVISWKTSEWLEMPVLQTDMLPGKIECLLMTNYCLNHLDIRYDTRFYFNGRSKADVRQLNLPLGAKN